MIRAIERDTYETAWAVPQYADYAPGEGFASLFDQWAHRPGDTVLDAGCGSGKGALALRQKGYDVRLLDCTRAGLVPEAQTFPFVEACLWDPLGPKLGYLFGRKADWVYCCDVLEHIPPVFTMLVVARLLDVTRKGLFLTVSTVQDQFGPFVGKSLHQTVQNFTDWRDQLQEICDVEEARDYLVTGIFYLRPRC